MKGKDWQGMNIGEHGFQDWVTGKLLAVGHVQRHNFSALPDIPDLSAAAHGTDFWLELKYGEFSLRHSGYSQFRYSTTKRGQLEWLKKRAKAGKAICGVLGYAFLYGDHGNRSAYLTFNTPEFYLRYLWADDVSFNVGAMILSGWSRDAHSVKTGLDLLEFLYEAHAACHPKRWPAISGRSGV